MLLTILHQDDHLLVVDKPNGLIVHRSSAARDAENCLSLARAASGRWVYPAHRLDRGTSGVLLFTFDPESARRVWERFATHDVGKEYLAIVRGHTLDAGLIDHALSLDDREERVEARTSYVTLARGEVPFPVGPYESARYSLVRAEPQTGRTHQIRRHMKHIDHPIIGDTTHGDSRHNRFMRSQYDMHRMLLHAWRLTIPHPATGERLTFTAPSPLEFVRLYDIFGWTAPSAEPAHEALAALVRGAIDPDPQAPTDATPADPPARAAAP